MVDDSRGRGGCRLADREKGTVVGCRPQWRSEEHILHGVLAEVGLLWGWWIGIAVVVVEGIDSVGPKAISSSFDDNKTYVVMFLIILLNKVLG